MQRTLLWNHEVKDGLNGAAAAASCYLGIGCVSAAYHHPSYRSYPLRW